MREVLADLHTKSWVVNQQPPTLDAELINAYLSRYICRIGISDQRLSYDKTTKTVSLTYKDYRRQQAGQVAPPGVLKLLPLVAMNKILQHVLPPNFHRTRAWLTRTEYAQTACSKAGALRQSGPGYGNHAVPVAESFFANPTRSELRAMWQPYSA
jgi:hypothetical protein